MRTVLAAALLVGTASGAGAHGIASHAQAGRAPAPAGEVRGFPVETLAVADAPVLDQTGARRRFRSDVIGDGPVIVTFTYTACTTVCPVANGIMALADALLDAEGDARTRLVSVSVDPVNDTPARLRAVADAFGADARWSMVTGKAPDIADVLRSLGLQPGAAEDHDPMFLVGDGATMRFTRFAGLPDPEALVAALPDRR